MGQARTGTGKTAAFVIPILEQLDTHQRGQGPQAIVLVPTRELAVQVKGEADKLAHGRKLHIVAIYGGKPIKGQIEKLRRGADIIIGTPGRVLDHLARGTLVSERREDRRARRSRPDARHRLSARYRKDPPPRAAIAADAAAQRHRAAAGAEACRALHARSGVARLFADGHCLGDDRAVLLHRRSGAEVRAVGAAPASAKSRGKRSSSAGPSGERTRSIIVCRGSSRTRPASTATCGKARATA